MKKIICLIFLCLIVAGAFGCAERKEKPIRIGDMAFSKEEFDSSFAKSRYAELDGQGRGIFLDQFISRKLILKEAEEMGMDKDPRFLNDIRMFYEQTLLKFALDKKNNELMNTVRVTEGEIKDYYGEHNKTVFSDRSLEEVYDQIQWILFKEKQAKVMAQWTEELKKKTAVKIDYKALGINK